MPRGAGVCTTSPPPQRHRERRKGGPLWLQVPGYVLPVTLCQDQRRVSTTAALVTTRTGFHLQVRPLIDRLGAGEAGGSGPNFGTNCEISRPCRDCGTVAPRPSPGPVGHFSGSQVTR